MLEQKVLNLPLFALPNLDAQVANGVVAGGGGGGSDMSYEELMKEIGEVQKIIFDENSKENEVADANIK